MNWYHKPKGNGSTDAFIAHLPAVRNHVRREADKLGIKAELKLVAHHRTGDAEIKVIHSPERGQLLDSYVALFASNETKEANSSASMAIEFGHLSGKRGSTNRKWVEGLHILSGLL